MSSSEDDEPRRPQDPGVAKLPIQIRTLDGRIYKIDAKTNWTVQQLKKEFEKWHGEEEAARCNLFYRAKRLNQDQPLNKYKIEPGAVVQANFRSKGGFQIF